MSGYIGTQPVPQATQTRDAFTATSGQTSFATSGYTPNFLDVFLNGVKMAAADYTASNGSDVVLATGAATGDILEVVAYTTFDTANVTGAANFTVTGSFTSQGIDDNANATAITIDSSENVLVGTTNSTIYASSSNTTADDGFVARSDGIVGISRQATTSSNPALYVNVTGLDSEIVQFRKDGSSVGSIGATSGDLMIGTTDTGFRFLDGAEQIIPWNVTGNTNKDGVLDLGNSTNRFDNLYLSGGVVFGDAGGSGTSSSNSLDSYEEGNWVPSLGGNASYSIQSGQYTKIGRLVFVQGILSVGTLGTGSATTVSGLPFPANNVHSSNQGGSITYFASLAVNVITPTTYVADNTQSFSVNSRVSAGTAIASAAIFGNSARIDFSITYETDS